MRATGKENGSACKEVAGVPFEMSRSEGLDAVTTYIQTDLERFQVSPYLKEKRLSNGLV
jgi:hypothetical protein